MDEYYAKMVVEWLREMAHNNYTDIRKMVFLDAILDIRERAETGLATYFHDKQGANETLCEVKQMPDLEKIRRGLLHCLVEPMCANCPYWKTHMEKRSCQAELLEDADVLMKEQAEAIRDLNETARNLLEQIKKLGSN